MHESWYSCERVSKTDVEQKKLLNKAIIFVFFGHENNSGSFKKLKV